MPTRIKGQSDPQRSAISPNLTSCKHKTKTQKTNVLRQQKVCQSYIYDTYNLEKHSYTKHISFGTACFHFGATKVAPDALQDSTVGQTETSEVYTRALPRKHDPRHGVAAQKFRGMFGVTLTLPTRHARHGIWCRHDIAELQADTIQSRSKHACFTYVHAYNMSKDSFGTTNVDHRGKGRNLSRIEFADCLLHDVRGVWPWLKRSASDGMTNVTPVRGKACTTHGGAFFFFPASDPWPSRPLPLFRSFIHKCCATRVTNKIWGRLPLKNGSKNAFRK